MKTRVFRQGRELIVVRPVALEPRDGNTLVFFRGKYGFLSSILLPGAPDAVAQREFGVDPGQIGTLPERPRQDDDDDDRRDRDEDEF